MSLYLRTAAVLGLRFLFLTRYSWLLALALVALPPLALSAAPSLLENLFVLDQPIQMFHVSWIAMFCSASVIATLRITALNAIDRFEDYRRACSEFNATWGRGSRYGRRWYQHWEGWLTLLLGCFSAIGIWYVIVLACVTRTASDPTPAWGEYSSAIAAEEIVGKMAWNEALKGAGMTLGILALIYSFVAVHEIWLANDIETECAFRSRRKKRTVAGGPEASGSGESAGNSANDCEPIPMSSWYGVYHFLARISGPGYFREVVYRCSSGLRRQIVLAPGHATMFLSTSMFLGWYAWNYLSVLQHGKMPDESSAMPALFFGLLSLLLVILILPGVAFLLDRHRIPILPTVLIFMAVFYGIFGTDHYYELNPEQSRVTSIPAPSIDSIYDGWKLPTGVDGHRTLVVVDASGGGIQAAAWTAQVLTGLHEIYGDEFSRSIGLISSVSGGSVGTMFYLVNRSDSSTEYDPQNTPSVLNHESIDRIRTAARASGLEASCWGIAYPDTMRALFPPLAQKTIDRGWSIEQIWRERMAAAGGGQADVRLSDLSRLSVQNQLPVIAFNSTIVETGQRLVISPALGPPKIHDQSGEGREFLREFPRSHLRLSTAARLSATFPYVTPVSRPLDHLDGSDESDGNPLRRFHVADGAYADNEGVVTSVDWLNRLLVHYSRPENIVERPFDRVLLIRIQAFPRQQTKEWADHGSLAGWRAALLGPFDTMMQVRSASQTERGDLEINLLTRATLAEIRAARERSEREYEIARSYVEQLRAIREEFNRLSASTIGKSSDLAREFMNLQDQLHMAEGMLRSAGERSRLAHELLVESVVFDFQPVDQVRIPMSWKLTSRQMRQIDRTWLQLVDGQLPLRPLDVLDRYFHRDQSSRPRPSSGQISANRPARNP